MARLLKIILPLVLLLLPIPAAASGVSVAGGQQVLFQGGTAGYGCFRIPVLVRTAAGSLLAFAEARKSASCADRGDIDLVARRSTNDGRTWGPIKVVTSGSPDDPGAPFTRGNAVPVVDRVTGRVLLVTTSNEATISGQRLPWVQDSTDDGLTWSPPRAVQASFDGTHDGWFATGPAHGIQLQHGPHAGRLIVGAHQKPQDGTVLAGVLYSDNGGDSWQASAVPNSFVDGQLSPGEIAVAELPDGSVYAAARNEIDGGNHRAKAISTDGGTTFPTFVTVPSLVTPNVQGSVLALQQTYRSTPGDTLVFAGPSDPTDRKQMKIRYSVDRGNTWSSPANGLVTNDRSGYSDLAELAGGELGLVYEAGATFSADEIRFARFTPGQLGLPGTNVGQPSTQAPTPAGDTTPDVSPQANDAYLAGNATLNDGLLLDGTGDHADVPYSPSLDPGTGDFTITFRFRYQATATTPNQALFWAYGVGTDVPQVWLRAQPGSDQLLAWVQGKSAGVSVAAKDPVASRAAFGDDAWHQVALKRTGGKVDLTVDGVTHTESGVVGVVSDGTTGVRIGGKQDATGSDGFKGRIRDFQLVRAATVLRLPFQAVDKAVVPTRTVYPVAEDVSGHCAAATVLGGIQLGAGRSADSSALQVGSAHPGVEAPFGPALDVGDGDFTFALWFRYQASAASPNQALMWAYGSTSGKRSLWVRAQPSQDRMFAWVETASGPVSVPLTDPAASRVAFGDNAWHLLTLTRSGSSARLGVDGTFASQGGLSGSVSGDQADAIKGLRLGSKLDGSDVLTGSLDDFRLYRRALSTTEVTKAAGGDFPGENPGLWWTFNGQNTQAHSIVDPVTGAQTPDSSVHCVQAAVSGSPTVVAGKVGGAVQFDGADDSVRVPYRPSLALGGGDFTISAWVKYTAGTADQVIFWGYGTGATERSVWLRAQPSKDRLYGYVQTDTGAYEFSGVDGSAGVAFGDGTWHHVALRRAGGSLGLFVDGTQVGSGSVSGSLTYGDTFAVDGFTLGMKPDGTDRFKGSMDLFEIQRRALSDAELREVDGDFGSVTAIRLGLDNAS